MSSYTEKTRTDPRTQKPMDQTPSSQVKPVCTHFPLDLWLCSDAISLKDLECQEGLSNHLRIHPGISKRRFKRGEDPRPSVGNLHLYQIVYNISLDLCMYIYIYIYIYANCQLYPHKSTYTSPIVCISTMLYNSIYQVKELAINLYENTSLSTSFQARASILIHRRQILYRPDPRSGRLEL